MFIVSVIAIIVSVIGIGLGLRANSISRVAKDAAVRSAEQAENSAIEAQRSRLDELGPSVSIIECIPQYERWQVLSTRETEDMTHPQRVQPNSTFRMPADGEVRICVAAILTLRNEGSRTSQVLFEVDRIDDVTSPYGISVLTDPENSSHQIHTVLREKRVSIAPQEVRQVFVRCGPTIEEWFEGDQSAIWKNTFLVSAYASIEGARQNWALSFEAQLFTTNPRYMGDVTLRANVLPSTMIAELPRTYP